MSPANSARRGHDRRKIYTAAGVGWGWGWGEGEGGGAAGGAFTSVMLSAAAVAAKRARGAVHQVHGHATQEAPRNVRSKTPADKQAGSPYSTYTQPMWRMGPSGRPCLYVRAACVPNQPPPQ